MADIVPDVGGLRRLTHRIGVDTQIRGVVDGSLLDSHGLP
jgi:hypothetical protein